MITGLYVSRANSFRKSITMGCLPILLWGLTAGRKLIFLPKGDGFFKLNHTSLGLSREEPSISSTSSKLIVWLFIKFETISTFFFLSIATVFIDPVAKKIKIAMADQVTAY